MSLKFKCVWILFLKISGFGLYLLKFRGVWILQLEVSGFGFLLLKFYFVFIRNHFCPYFLLRLCLATCKIFFEGKIFSGENIFGKGKYF